MKVPGLMLAVAAGLRFIASGAVADSAPKVDYAFRNQAFASTTALPAETNRPAVEPTLQPTPGTYVVTSPARSALSVRRVAIEVRDTRAKRAIRSDIARPAARDPVLSSLDRRATVVITSVNIVRPPLVSKYQSGLAPGGAISVGRLPARSENATATFNRFVLRRHAPAPAAGSAIRAGRGAAQRNP